MHLAFFQKWKISSALFPSSVRRESWIPVENRKMLLEKYTSGRIPALKNSRFCVKMPFCFYMEKHLIKEVNNFWWRNCDCASTAAHSNLKQECSYTFISKLFSLSAKTPNLASNCHFVSWWKSIYLKRYSAFDSSIRIMRRLDRAELCEEVNTRVLLNINIRITPFFFP